MKQAAGVFVWYVRVCISVSLHAPFLPRLPSSLFLPPGFLPTQARIQAYVFLDQHDQRQVGGGRHARSTCARSTRTKSTLTRPTITRPTVHEVNFTKSTLTRSTLTRSTPRSQLQAEIDSKRPPRSRLQAEIDSTRPHLSSYFYMFVETIIIRVYLPTFTQCLLYYYSQELFIIAVFLVSLYVVIIMDAQ